MANWNAEISTVDQFALHEYSISYEIPYDDDNDDDETLFECQDLIDWVSNSILMWGYQLILVIEKV